MKSRGFTLIEVLLAVALLALGVTIAFATLRSAIGSVERGQALANRIDQVRAAQHFLRRQFAAATPRQWLSEDSDVDGDRTQLLGEPELLRFVAPMPGYLSHGGPYLQTLRLVSDGETLSLLFEHAMLVGDTLVAEPDREPAVLLEGIADARFYYRGLDELGEMLDWQDQWPSMVALPMMIRLDVRFEDASVRWPPLVVEVPLASSTQTVSRVSTRPVQRPANRTDDTR
ncbi:MAG: prepilin-type N-terminal cleavage/methylation domain-containing protein [Xanthomonadaceae bacterium]|nr:prepilin-type N-terminal cleavage/methylation domain-containing protein [Xanthomonadaceae bacterium]